MIFTAQISTSIGGGTANSPKRTVIDVRWGVVHKIEIDIPSGHKGLTGIRLFHAEILKWPTTAEGWFTGNEVVISFPVFFPLLHEPFFFVAETYNNDTGFAHLFNVRIGILPPWAVYFSPKSQWDAWGKQLFE